MLENIKQNKKAKAIVAAILAALMAIFGLIWGYDSVPVVEKPTDVVAPVKDAIDAVKHPSVVTPDVLEAEEK